MRNFIRFGLFALTLVATGCEVPAADGTVEILIENLSPQDIQSDGRILGVVAGLSGGACAEGPCSPNPCPMVGGVEGATACIGMGDVAQCRCPAGTHVEMDEMTMEQSCVQDMECLPNTCNGHGMCSPDSNPPLCMCDPGWTGSRCDQCDGGEGFFPDGLGGCSQMVDVCREGLGTEDFQKIIADAEAELGAPPTELEISGARLEVVPNSALGVRNWQYLWNDEITLYVQTVGNFPQNAGSVAVPPADAALEPLEFDMTITRPVTSQDPLFLSGDFRVGIQGETDRQLTEEFGIDLKLTLDVNAY